MRGLWLALCLGLMAAPAARAQQQQPDLVRSPVLMIDFEEVFVTSMFGQRVLDEVRAETEELAAQNRRIEAALDAEEKSLTERRPTMSVEEFRAEAEAFDEKVEGIRQAQDAKERALRQATPEAREALLRASTPIIGQLMADRGGAIVLDRRSVLIAIDAIDITDEAIAAIDAAIGQGESTIPDIIDPEAPLPE
jgi:Skp family chaperone for outer membrane proteins